MRYLPPFPSNSRPRLSSGEIQLWRVLCAMSLVNTCLFTACGIHMKKTRAAQLEKNGASQAVSIPAGFRIEGSDVYATRNDTNGDVLLSHRPGSAAWNPFFELMDTVEIPADFMAERPMNVMSEVRDVFDVSRPSDDQLDN